MEGVNKAWDYDVRDPDQLEALVLQIVPLMPEHVCIPATLIYELALELLHSKEELLKLSVFETVDEIVDRDMEDMADSITLAADAVRRELRRVRKRGL